MVTPIKPAEAKPATSHQTTTPAKTKETTQTKPDYIESDTDRLVRSVSGGLLGAIGGPLTFFGKTISDWKNSFNKEPETN